MIKEPRILILEDQPTDAELAMRELRRAQIAFEAKRVDTKESFLQALKEFDPDVILSDFSLPQFNALDALDLLHGKRGNCLYDYQAGAKPQNESCRRRN